MEADFLQKLIEEGNTDAIEFLNRAKLTENDNIEKAILALNRSIEFSTNLHEAFNLLGIANFYLGRNQEAVLYYDQAIELDPKFAKAYCNRGLAKAKLGYAKEAIKDYNEAIEYDPIWAIAYYNRGIVKNDLGYTEEAIMDYSEAIDLNPEYAAAYCNRGVVKTELDMNEEAILDFDRAIQLNPKLADSYSNRGIAKIELGMNEEAILDFDRAIELDPNDADSYSNRGIAKTELGMNEEAILNFDRAIQLNPKLANFYSNRAIAKTKMGMNKEAILDCDLAIYLNNYLAIPYINRGNAKFALGRNREAILDFDVGIELNPKLEDAYFSRGIAKSSLGFIGEANRDFFRACFLLNKIISVREINIYFNHFSQIYPLQIRNIIAANPNIRTSIQYGALVSENEKKCKALNFWVAWLKAKYPDPNNKKVNWLRALILFHGGDPITAYELLDVLDDGEQILFHQQYYFILAADLIQHEERKAILNFAKSKALEYINKNERKDDQNYWAARLLMYCHEEKAEIHCLSKINKKDVFHLLCKAKAIKQTDEDASQIIKEAITEGHSTKSRHSTFLESDSIKQDDSLDKQIELMESLARYFDMEETINEIFAEGEVAPRFWELLDTSDLIEPLRNHYIATLDNKLKDSFEKTLIKIKDDKSPDDSIFKSMNESYRWEAFKELNQSEDLVFEISLKIYQSKLPSETLSDLLEYFYLDGKLPTKEVYYLYFYLSVCRKINKSHIKFYPKARRRQLRT